MRYIKFQNEKRKWFKQNDQTKHDHLYERYEGSSEVISDVRRYYLDTADSISESGYDTWQQGAVVRLTPASHVHTLPCRGTTLILINSYSVIKSLNESLASGTE